MPHHSAVPHSSTRSPDSALPVPATYLRDKLRAAQSAFPHLDLHLPNNWWNMTDAGTRELWEEKTEEFRFHDYTHSVRIADEMIRRYDDRAEADGLRSYRASPTLCDTTPNVSALPTNEDIANVTLGYQPSISGEVMEAPKISSNSPPSGRTSNTVSNLFISEMGISDKGACLSLNEEGAELASAVRQDFSNGVSTTPGSPGGTFVLTLGDPACGPAQSNHSVYSPGSPLSSTASFELSVIGDDRWITEHLEVTEGGNFVVYKESQKEDFDIWWEQTTWAEGVNYGKHRHPHWNSSMRTALFWRKFIEVANRLTGEPRMPSVHPVSVTKAEPRPFYSSSPCLTGSPDGGPAPTEHETTLAPKLAETMPNPASEKRKYPVIDTEFGAAIKRAKKEYIKKKRSGAQKNLLEATIGAVITDAEELRGSLYIQR